MESQATADSLPSPVSVGVCLKILATPGGYVMGWGQLASTKMGGWVRGKENFLIRAVKEV